GPGPAVPRPPAWAWGRVGVAPRRREPAARRPAARGPRGDEPAPPPRTLHTVRVTRRPPAVPRARTSPAPTLPARGATAAGSAPAARRPRSARPVRARR